VSDIKDPNIYLDGNDKIETFYLTTPNSLTGEPEAATGLTLTVHYSLTKSGATIHSDVSKSLTEYADTDGLYHATQTGTAITARLAAYETSNPRIFAVVKDASGSVRGNFDRFIKATRSL
jgi:hypothetical protein